MDFLKKQIGIIGLGYVGLPLAAAFSNKYKVVGFDIDKSRISELLSGIDRTGELSPAELQHCQNLRFSDQANDLADCDIYIVTVPTPIDSYKKPDLTPLLSASRMVGQMLKKGDLVIYESTVYPGCTEEDCVPVLEESSGLQFNSDFFCGYSPERINPGDKINTLVTIKKVTSGSTPRIAQEVDALYASIIHAGTYAASSIKVAEASKAIENAQRDINISFVNELALIFDRMEIDTSEVLEAASTKWNFLPYKPGLVGGHCIGVDPYYLTYKAESLGYFPQVILSGRRVNDNMSVFVANKLVKLMIKKGHRIEGSKVLILGVTFKENCPDIRNTKVIDVYRELQEFGLEVSLYDPWALPEQVYQEYGITLIPSPKGPYNAVLVAVAHRQFLEAGLDGLLESDSVVYDLKSVFPKDMVDLRL